MNGDGLDEVLVGAPSYDNGRVFAYRWAGGLLKESGFLEGNEFGAGLGASVGTAGDVNGDGFDEVSAVGPRHDADDDGQYDEGAAFVYGKRFAPLGL